MGSPAVDLVALEAEWVDPEFDLVALEAECVDPEVARVVAVPDVKL